MNNKKINNKSQNKHLNKSLINHNKKNNKVKNNNNSTLDSTNNVVKMKTEFNSQNFICIKKLKIGIIAIIIIFVLLLVRIGYIQFWDGNNLKEIAYKQQTINQIISPKRGNIYDSTGQALAISAQVDTITINPTKIKDSKDDEEKTKALKEKVAKRTFRHI